MSFTLSATRSHIIDKTNNNKLQYDFRAPVKLDNHEIKLNSIVMYNSVFNIKKGVNDTFRFIWVDGTQYTVEIPEGHYEIEDLNSFLYQFQFNNGLYLTTSDQKVLIFLEFIVNSTYYACQVNTYPYPTAQEITDNEYTIPSNGYTPDVSYVSRTPQLIIPADNEFGLLLGFSAGTYPPEIEYTTYSINSNNGAPQISPVSAYHISCSLVNNLYTQRSDLIGTFSPQAAYGSQFFLQFQNSEYMPIPSGTFSNMHIQILDQTYSDVKIQDPELIITFVIREKGKRDIETNIKNLPVGFQRT